jgi:hypothetical protein
VVYSPLRGDIVKCEKQERPGGTGVDHKWMILVQGQLFSETLSLGIDKVFLFRYYSSLSSSFIPVMCFSMHMCCPVSKC